MPATGETEVSGRGEAAGDVGGIGHRLGLAAEPGGELGVEAGVGRDREHRAERDFTAAGLGRQDALGHGEHPGREFGVEFGGRLLEMLLLLQARGGITAAELARRLEVSPRTVYRDAEAPVRPY
jgi:hypothetical protein